MSVDILREKLVAVADAVRDRVEITDKMTLDQMPPYIDGISTDASHTEVATIIGDGESWIDSMINPTSHYTIETRFRVIGFESGRSDSPFGYLVNSLGDGSFGIQYDAAEDGVLKVVYASTSTAGGEWYTDETRTKQSCRHFKTYRLSNGTFSIDGVNLNTFTTSTTSASNTHSYYSLYLMAMNVNKNGDPGTGNIGLLEVCYYKIWDQNDKLILDLVPAVKSDGTVCMYDKVSSGYYYNKGTGTFGYALTTGTEVTYYITTDTYYVEEREEGEDCLPPETFTPALSGYNFVGWAETDGSDYTPEYDTFDGIPAKYEASTISSKIMGIDPISLYGVFSAAAKGINVYTSTLDSKTGAYIPNQTPTFYPYDYYYNNGNTIVDCFGPWEVEDPNLTLSDAEKGCMFGFYDSDSAVAWSGGSHSKPTNGLRFGGIPDPTKLMTYYGVYERLLSIVYRSAIGVTTSQVESSKVMNYWNSNGQTKLNSFSISTNYYFKKDGYTFKGWANTYDSNIYQPGDQFAPNCSGTRAITLYPTWQRNTTVLFDNNDAQYYCWRQGNRTAYGWGTATACLYGDTNSSSTFNVIDCTDYSYCVVRIYGNVTGDPSGATVNNGYVRIGFTTDPEAAIGSVDGTYLAHRYNNTSGGSSDEGLIVNGFYDLVIDVSTLTGTQTLNVFSGDSYGVGCIVWCSKITLTNDLTEV